MVTESPDPKVAIAEQVRREARLTIERTQQSLDLLINRNEPAVGLTPKDTIYADGTLRLYRYRPLEDEVYRVPIIFVMSLISKPYILDLVPGQSFVEYLLKQGFDVYMVDWGVPRPEDSSLRLEDYVLEKLPRCVEEVQHVTKEQEVSFLGYCMGGLFALMYAGLFSKGPLKNLIAIATPVDFEQMGLLRRWADPRWFDVDQIVDTLGNIPPEMIRTSLELLRPLDRLMGYINLWENLWDDEFVYNWRIRYKWVNEQIPFPGECFRQITKELMRDNKLIKGELILGGRRVDLARANCSLLHVMAEFDHIAPYKAARPLTSIVGSADKQDMALRGGHVSLISGQNAVLRLWPTVNEWLTQRSV